MVPRTNSSARRTAMGCDQYSYGAGLQDLWRLISREVEKQDSMAWHPRVVQDCRVNAHGFA